MKEDKPADTNRYRWLPAAIAIYLIGIFLWRTFVPAHEFQEPESRTLHIVLDFMCILCLIGLHIQNSRKQLSVTFGFNMLFWFALLAGLGLFAIRLSGHNGSWSTGHLNFERLPRSTGQPGHEIPANRAANTVANDTNTGSNTSAPAAPGSPSEAYKAYYAAYKNKDIKTLKTMFSKDMFSLTYSTHDRKKADELIDHALTVLVEKPQGPSDDIRNEKITGTTATAECIGPIGNWEPLKFVKEDGKWKLTP